MSMHRIFSCVVGRGCLLWPRCSLAKLCYPLTCFILYFKAKFASYSRYLLTSYFCIPVPYDEKDWCFGVLSRSSLIGLHRTFNFFGISGWVRDLDYCDTEWFALEKNRDHSVVFETASKYCISDSFIDHDGYSISSKGFLPAVDVMVIWVKFTHFSPFFSSLIPKMSMFTLAVSC